MVALTANQIIIIIVGLTSIVPTIVLFRQYLKTRITDFLIFSAVYLTVTIGALSQIFVTGEEFLIFVQIHRLALDTTFFLFFIHGARIIWTRTPAVVWGIGLSWYGVLIFLTLFFEVMPQQDAAYVLLMVMPAVPTSYHPLGAGVETVNGVVLYSSSYLFLGTLYLLFCMAILLYAYITIELPIKTQKMIRTKKLWVVVWTLILIYGILHVPWVFVFLQLKTTTLVNLFPLAGELISALIAILIPESMLISHAQILRAVNLYKEVIVLSPEQATKRFGSPSLVEYLQNIPPEIIGSTWESLDQQLI